MFTHLHIHTEYSLLDGMCRIPQLISRAKDLGMDSLAITDHGVMYGAIEFYEAAIKAGIKPIIGCEVYVAPGSRFNHSAEGKSSYHLILLARNQTGYRNLIQLTTKANLEGFYYKPRVDREILEEYHEGLIALSACIGGEVPQLILRGQIKEAEQVAQWYKQTFGEYFLEIQRHPMPELEEINRHLIRMSVELDIPLVATNDVHYINKEDAAAHDLLMCIGTNSSVNDEKRRKMAGDFFYLRSPQEMAELYQDIPQALENTGYIADLCDLKLEFGRLHLPEIELPEGKTADQFLAGLCHENLHHYYPNTGPEIEKRLDYELDVIRQTQFANYFLVVWDIISFTQRSNILFGVRGSAAASIVLHCLGITDIDPIEHNLVFERFLNLERKEMPDIDLDFEDDRRDEVIAYVSQKYGQDHVAQIITFGTLGAKAAIRDAGRALGMPYGDVDRVSKLVPLAPGMTLERALEESNELNSIYREEPLVSKLINSAKSVEGIARHASTHAAGIVISKEPLARYVPLQRGSRANGDESTMTQFTMGAIARIGLLKMDFLGLANLSILGKAKEIIQQNHGISVDLHNIPMDDARTFALLSSGETAGVFQLEGTGMRRYIKDLKPTIFSDIAAMVALYRPGPMEHIPTFIKAKHGHEAIRYPHPALTRILEETYGVIVYQDQVLFIVQAFAGYSLGQADIFRKAMGKKIASVMKKEKRNFIAGAKENGYSTELAEEVFALIEPFAGYAFNKAHSVSYALVAYQTAYLKANYPADYMTAFMVIHTGQTEKIGGAITECRRLGIIILPPDINKSQVSFSTEKGADGTPAIRFGLTAIKNVGSGAIEPVVKERNDKGAFKSIEDLCRRCDLRSMNKRVMESLIKAGAFDSLGSRGTLLSSIDRILSLSQREQRLRETGQSTMFDLWGEELPMPMPSLELDATDIPVREKLAWEKELMGIYLSEHPFSPIASKIGKKNTLCGQITAEMAGQNIVVAGMVASVRNLFTRNSRPFASAILEDLDGQVEVLVWPKVFTDTRELWQEGNFLLVEGKVRVKDDRVQLNCDLVSSYEIEGSGEEEFSPETAEAPAPTPAEAIIEDSVPLVTRQLLINLRQTSDEKKDEELLHEIITVLKDFPGRDEVKFRIVNDNKITNLKLQDLNVDYCPELEQRLSKLIGEDSLNLAATG